ncbi:MAG: hypothetical protein WCP96_12350 [Methylococcaceae bacterium]
MHTTEIQDLQFGILRWYDHWGWCAEKVEWIPGLMVPLCIRTEPTESNTIPECAKTIFNTLRDREKQYLSLAAQRDMLDCYNEIWSDDDEAFWPDGWPVDANNFINLLRLYSVFIDIAGESELQYTTDGGPLLRVFISPDLSFKEALFD